MGEALERWQADDGRLRLRYLELLAQGRTRADAAQQCGLSYGWIKDRIKRDGAFKEQVQDAEALSLAPVEDELREAALAGEPWAVKMILERADRKGITDLPPPGPQGATVPASGDQHLHLHVGSPDERVADLFQQLAQRRADLASAGPQVLDVPAVD